MEIAMLFGGVASLFGAVTNKPPKPPELPATVAGPAKAPGAIVRVGADANKKTDNTGSGFVGFTEQRKEGQSLGGLGRGGLTI